MTDITLESLAARIAALEAKLLYPPPPTKDWRSVIGMFDNDPEFHLFLDEMEATREAERAAAREGTPE